MRWIDIFNDPVQMICSLWVAFDYLDVTYLDGEY